MAKKKIETTHWDTLTKEEKDIVLKSEALRSSGFRYKKNTGLRRWQSPFVRNEKYWLDFDGIHTVELSDEGILYIPTSELWEIHYSVVNLKPSRSKLGGKPLFGADVTAYERVTMNGDCYVVSIDPNAHALEVWKIKG